MDFIDMPTRVRRAPSRLEDCAAERQAAEERDEYMISRWMNCTSSFRTLFYFRGVGAGRPIPGERWEAGIPFFSSGYFGQKS